MESAIWIFLIGGIVVADTTAFSQTMINQPVVSCLVLGWALGDVKTGMLLGILLEYPWLRMIPAGGFISNQGSFGSLVCTAAALSWLRNHPEPYYPVLFLAVGYGFFSSYAGGWLTYNRRKVNRKLTEFAYHYAGRNISSRVFTAQIAGVAFSFISGGISSLLLWYCGVQLLHFVFTRFTVPDLQSFKIAVLSLAAVGCGTLISMVVSKKSGKYLIWGLAAGAAAGYWVYL